jgi:hypothetical protein
VYLDSFAQSACGNGVQYTITFTGGLPNQSMVDNYNSTVWGVNLTYPDAPAGPVNLTLAGL